MVWCEYQIWKALWKNLIHEFQKDSLIPNICSPLNLEETVCILHSAVLEGFVSVVHGRTFSVSFINKPQGFSCTSLPEHALYQAEFWY